MSRRRSGAGPSPTAAPVPPPRGARAHWAWLLGILLIAIAIRAAYLRHLVNSPDFSAPAGDALFHDYWARALVTGDWTPPPGEADPEIRTTPFLRPPGYPYFLAAVYWIAGKSYLAARIVQMAVGVLSCLLGYLLGRAIFGRTAGLIASLLLAVGWMFPYYEGELQEPFLLVFLLLVLLLVLHGWLRKQTFVRTALAGLLIGLAGLVQPNAMLFTPAVIVWFSWVMWPHAAWRKLGLHMFTLWVGMMLAVTPVTIRNYVVAHDAVAISSNGAINLYIGNNPQADGFTPRVPDIERLTGNTKWSWFSYGEIVRGLSADQQRPLEYSDVSHYFAMKALSYIKDNPGRCLALAAKRLLLFCGPGEVTNNKVVHYDRQDSALLRNLPGFPLALATACLSVVLLLVERRTERKQSNRTLLPANTRSVAVVLMLLLSGTYVASFLPFLVAERFRVSAGAVLMVIGAYGISRIGQWLTVRDWRRGAGWCAAGLALYGLASVPLVPYEPEPARWYTGRARACRQQGRIDQAVEECRAALRAQPGAPDVLVLLGDLLLQAGRPEQAAEQYRAAIAIAPSYADARRALADLLGKRGNIEDSIMEFRAAAEASPLDPKVHVQLGVALAQGGHVEEAEAAFRRAQQLDPRYAPAHGDLGTLLARQGKMQAAAAELREALRLDPDFADGNYNLGNVLSASGAFVEAIPEYRAALKATPNFADAHTNLGIALARTQQLDAAVDEFRQAIALDPRNFQAYVNLGLTLARKGQTQEAITALTEALRIRPNDDAARQALENLQRPTDSSHP